MGERQSGEGASGHRRALPGGAVPGPVSGSGGLEALLAAAVRVEGAVVDPEAEGRAVAAFLAARDAGEHQARTRRRDDWRPRERRHWAGRPAKATFAVVLGSLTLGGVAVAAIGSSGSSTDDADSGRSRSSVSAPAERSSTAGPSRAGSAPSDRPSTAKDTEAHCRAYEQVKDRGNVLNSTVWKRLVTAAGGEGNVAAYCAGQLAQPTPTTPGKATENPGSTKKPTEAPTEAAAEKAKGKNN